MTSLQNKTRGAALIVALLILAILLIIVLAFFQASRQEMHIAENYRNATQADLLAEGGTAIAIAFLNHDRAIHPTVTSIDHAWKTYFNGAWAAGKPWLWKDGVSLVRGEGDGVPELNLYIWNSVYPEPPGDVLYIPRVDNYSLFPVADPNDYDPVRNPFVVTYPYGVSPLTDATAMNGRQSGDAVLNNASSLGPQQIDRFADWDNDEDGLRDSAWIPMSMDVFPDGPDESDGIDNDLDGDTDEGFKNGRDDDGNGVIDDEPIKQLPAERALFVYWGGEDGLDNDGDGNIDDAAEQRLYLTTYLGPFDLDGNGTLDTLPNIEFRDFPNPDKTVGGVLTQSLNPNRGPVLVSQDVDKIDNDYNLVMNESGGYAYDLPSLDSSTWTADEKEKFRRDQANGYNLIASGYVGIDPAASTRRATFIAEPVCELVGRAAILVKDENSKVNMNAAGGRNFRDDDSPYVRPSDDTGGLRRALWSGASTAEYETRVLPQIGNATSDRMWNLRMGGHAGIGLASIADGYAPYIPPPTPAQPSDAATYLSAPLNVDVSLPGFGRVDDNGNALWMAMDGIDNDGDGLVDEGLADLPHWVPPTNIAAPNGTMDTDEAWTFEGIDEPQEYQAYRPLRDRDPFGTNNPTFAESDDADNSAAVETSDHPADGSKDEIGELGDRYLRSTEQLKLVQNMVQVEPTFSVDRYAPNRNLVTVNGVDLNSRFQRYDGNGDPLRDSNGNPVPKLSGPKLDYNYATVAQIYNAIQSDWGYIALPPTGPPEGGEVQNYALGLRREDTAIYSTGILAGGAANFIRPDGAVEPAFAPDPLLRAAQLAANIRDNRDPNLGRTEATTTIGDDWFKTVQNAPADAAPRQIEYTQAGFEAIRINEIMARAVRRVEAEMDTTLPAFDPNAFSAISGTPDFDMQLEQLDETNAPWTRMGSVIGDRSNIGTTELLVDPADPDSFNVIQFRFKPSPGLPPGRYYLMLNSMRVNTTTSRLEPTIVGSAIDPLTSPNIEYTFKYGTDTQDILTDLADDPAVVPWKDTDKVGYRNMQFPAAGAETGMVFLPSDATFNNAAEAGYGDNEAYTVEIPPYDTVNPANQLYLYVAIRFMEPVDIAAPELAINYFDFSQEPDHEWIEVVNTAQAGDPINIGGWQLQVGSDGMTNEGGGLVSATMLTVPPSTFIAPGGSLVLGFDKYDDGGRDQPGTSLLQSNGIGLARILDAAYAMYMTEPPIPGLLSGVAQQSVFARNIGDPDFIDWDGDSADDPDDQGIDGPPLYSVDLDGNGTIDLATDLADRAVASTFDPVAGVNKNKAFDRIVEMHVDQPTPLESVTDLDGLAAVVLDGGILPNYPEHDGIDNDGDNAAHLSDRVDNDGDGLIDEGVNLDDGIDNNGINGIDEADERIDDIDARAEGIDEGRWEYITDVTGTPLTPIRGLDPPGSYSTDAIPYTYANAANAYATLDPAVTPYIGSSTDPPEWKAFTERRWYTPDNVIVTLYAGTKADGHVADRVTYSERDVINRATDDILSTDINSDGTLDRDPLNPNLPSFWPDNTMGVDFYRSIERKHPLYNGDLHGLSNRWQATDGNYDDWSPSTSLWERVTATGLPASRVYDGGGVLLPNVWNLYYHAFSGSPLRMNMAERFMENPHDLFVANNASDRRWAFEKARAGIRNRTYVSPGDLASLVGFMDKRVPMPQPSAPTLGIAFDDVPINYDKEDSASTFFHQDTSVQGVMLGQHPYDNLYGRDDMAAVTSGAAMDPQVLSVGTANFYTITPQPTAWNADNWNGTVTANTTPEPWTPVFLFPLPGGDPAPGVQFSLDVNRLAGYAMNPLDNYLFTGPYGVAITNTAAYDPSVLPEADLAARWPLKLRTVMYASQNIAGFDPSVVDHESIPAATALFEWDGSDGLENGDYDVYILTADNLAPVTAADGRAAGNYLTQFGRNLAGAAKDTKQDMVFDVEMFTDRSYTGDTGKLEPLGPNGRCWIDGGNGNPADNYPQPGEFERSSGDPANPLNPLNPQGDSFGTLLSKHPDDDGIMYYGTVRVENNYLALLLRNWTSNGKLARFSRVILTPHPRTNGRLNINTVESVIGDYNGGNPDPDTLDNNGDGHLDGEFNPLAGTPGMLVDYNSTSPVRFGYFDEGDISPSDGAYLRALTLSDNVVLNRQRFGVESGLPVPIRYHPDGRYYDNASELVTPQPNELPNGDPMNTYPNFLSAAPTAPAANVYEEMMGRYSRLANLVTTRSDVFEVTVTAQTGYLSSEDLNNDGRIDYRNDFIVTGEKKIRTVYER